MSIYGRGCSNVVNCLILFLGLVGVNKTFLSTRHVLGVIEVWRHANQTRG
jgi:hypothetical protein